jgi:hypothetical protein
MGFAYILKVVTPGLTRGPASYFLKSKHSANPAIRIAISKRVEASVRGTSPRREAYPPQMGG